METGGRTPQLFDPLNLDWAESRVIWLRGDSGSGKTFAVAKAVRDFEADGGEALVHLEQVSDGRSFSPKLLAFVSSRDTLPAIEDITALRLSGGTDTPLLLVIEGADNLDVSRPFLLSRDFTERIGQVARNAEALNAWVILTSQTSNLAYPLGEMLSELREPMRVFDLKLIDGEEGEYREMHEASFDYEMGYRAWGAIAFQR